MKKHHQAVAVFLILLFILFVLKPFKDSLFFKKNGRFTYVIYAEQPRVISFNFSDKLHSIIKLDHNYEILVPGGYGKYRIGSLGKLAFLKHDYSLVNRAIALYISAPVVGGIIYDGNNIFDGFGDETLSGYFSQLFLVGYRSNITFFDRVYILIKLAMSSEYYGSFEILTESGEGDFIGKMYDKELRRENKTIQIMYSSYSAAENISQIMIGSGMRVVDMLLLDKDAKKDCLIIESSKEVSKSAEKIRDLIGCRIIRGETNISDIIVILDGNVEKLWFS